MATTVEARPPQDRGEQLWHTLPAAEVAESLGVDPARGLSAAEAAKRLEEHGPNRFTVTAVERGTDGVFTVTTNEGPLRAANVALALGRRGSPRKLGVPGEDLPKVAYSLLDAESHRGCRILVVGGQQRGARGGGGGAA